MILTNYEYKLENKEKKGISGINIIKKLIRLTTTRSIRRRGDVNGVGPTITRYCGYLYRHEGHMYLEL